MNKLMAVGMLSALLTSMAPAHAFFTVPPVLESGTSTPEFLYVTTTPNNSYKIGFLSNTGAIHSALAGVNVFANGDTPAGYSANKFQAFVCEYTSNNGVSAAASNQLSTVIQTADGLYHVSRGSDTNIGGTFYYQADGSSFVPAIPVSSNNQGQVNKEALVYSPSTTDPSITAWIQVSTFALFTGSSVPAPPWTTFSVGPAANGNLSHTPDKSFNFE